MAESSSDKQAKQEQQSSGNGSEARKMALRAADQMRVSSITREDPSSKINASGV